MQKKLSTTWKHFIKALPLTLLAMLLTVVGVLAGTNLDSPSGPTDSGSQMYTLEQIYDRLETGAWSAKTKTFKEPSSAPGSTGHTLDEVMVVARPGAIAPRVNKTGQTECWNSDGDLISCVGTGHDGEYQMGITPAISPSDGGYSAPAWTGVRFTNNGDGTVTDNLTGLIWLRRANCLIRGWDSALATVNGLANGSCGLSDGSSAGDWRLPNLNELLSLVDSTQSNPALPNNHHFSGVQSAFYWTSTTENYRLRAYGVDMSVGGIRYELKGYSTYVWPVRGGN